MLTIASINFSELEQLAFLYEVHLKKKLSRKVI
jgi:hypothetical protein